MFKKFLSLLSFLLLATPAYADTYVTVQHPIAVWDSTLGSVYALGIPGKGQSGLSTIPSLAGTNNFTGTFEINGVVQVFPASGLLVGTTDAQTLTNKTLTAPVVGTSLTLSIGTASPLLITTAALQNGAAAATGTLTNAPAAGNPTKWIPINDNGTTRYIPAW